MKRCPYTVDGEHRWREPRNYVIRPPLGSPAQSAVVQPSNLKQVTYQWCKLCDERRELTS